MIVRTKLLIRSVGLGRIIPKVATAAPKLDKDISMMYNGIIPFSFNLANALVSTYAARVCRIMIINHMPYIPTFIGFLVVALPFTLTSTSTFTSISWNISFHSFAMLLQAFGIARFMFSPKPRKSVL